MDLQLNDYQAYKQYFSSIAASSKYIDGFLHGDVNLGQREAADWQGLKLWAWPADRSRSSDIPDNFILGREGSIWIGGPCASELHSDQEAFYQTCEVVMKKVVGKLIRDRVDGVIAVSLDGHLERADIDISATKFIGCEFKFTITDPDGFEFDQSDWE
jgi:hypothetical protein